MRIQCRRLMPEDLNTVADIEAEVQIDPWSREQVLDVEKMLNEHYHGWIAQDGHRICAYLIVRKMMDESELLTIGVSKDKQGLGIGQILWQHGWSDLRITYPLVQSCFLEVRESNLAAQTLYARCGFNLIGRRRGYYHRQHLQTAEDALILKKNDD